MSICTASIIDNANSAKEPIGDGEEENLPDDDNLQKTLQIEGANEAEIKRGLCKALFSAGKRHRVAGARIFSSNELQSDGRPQQKSASSTFRVAKQNVYLWPNLSEHEKAVIRDAFHQISRRTCIRFTELDYKPWYHAERWMEEKPYVVIRKSKKFTGYSDNTIEGINRRSLLYITDGALNHNAANQSRGMVIAQLLRFMGFREENLRSDAPSYLQARKKQAGSATRHQPHFSSEQLQWPFDPESVSIAAGLRDTHKLTMYCKARKNANIGAGQRAGLLTRWDAVKLNSMYCPRKVGYADPRLGPCVLPRKKHSH